MKKNTRKVLIILTIILIATLLSLLFIIFFTIPNLSLKGDKNIVLEFSNQYNEDGYNASLLGKDYTKKVKLKSNINYDKLGDYTIEYIIQNKLGTRNKKLKRNIKIIDTESPVITLIGSDLLLDLHQQYIEPGYSAIDNYDGDITSKIEIESNLDINKEGRYKILYRITDTSGNEAKVERNINVILKNITSVPILTYHNFMSDEEKRKYAASDKYVVSTTQFEKQLKYLKENGYNTISLEDFYKWYKGDITLTEKDIVIVIDDGNISSYIYAIPLLEKYNFQATIFVITGRIQDYEQTWDPTKNRFLDKNMINDIKNYHRSINLQSHTHNLHQQIDGKIAISVNTKQEIEEDFILSKNILDAEYLAFPYGGNTEFTEELLKKNGYKMAFGFGISGYGRATKSDNQYYIKRVNINAETTQKEFIEWLEVKQ